MISEEMIRLSEGSSSIRAMFEEGKRLASIYGAENVYDFSLGNPSVEPPAKVKEAIINILNTEDPNFIHGYTNNSGYEDVRQSIADYTNKKFGTNFSYENIVMTNGDIIPIGRSKKDNFQLRLSEYMKGNYLQ